jgi:abortive infection bacteriophage resistance protein
MRGIRIGRGRSRLCPAASFFAGAVVSKPFSTYEQMVAILRSRNLDISEAAIPILKRENYYSLINGYKDFFLDPDAEAERYRDGTSFSDIYNLFVLDRALRYCFFKRILDVETTMKSIISYRASEYYQDDAEFYLRFDAYTKDKGKGKQVIATISNMYKLLDSGSDSVRHYRKKHGSVPFWVLIKDMTFGSVSYFYDLLGPMELKDRIANDLSAMLVGSRDKLPWTGGRLSVKDVRRDLWVLADFRNVCAHGERFYCHICERIRTGATQRADASYLFRTLARYSTEQDIAAFMEDIHAIVDTTIKQGVMPFDSMAEFLATLGFEVTDAEGNIVQSKQKPRS